MIWKLFKKRKGSRYGKNAETINNIGEGKGPKGLLPEPSPEAAGALGVKRRSRKGGNKMALRDDINDLMKSEIQRFREELLTEGEQKEIEEDVMAFCIIEIRKYCGDTIFEQKAQELKDKGIDKLRAQVKVGLRNE